MVILLTARRRRTVGLEERQDDTYALAQLPGTMIRHALGLESLAVRTLAIRMIEPPFRAAFVPASGLPSGHLAGGHAADDAAVPVTAVATPAEEENLSAGATPADDEAKRVQVSAPTAKNWTTTRNRATKASSNRVSADGLRVRSC